MNFLEKVCVAVSLDTDVIQVIPHEWQITSRVFQFVSCSQVDTNLVLVVSLYNHIKEEINLRPSNTRYKCSQGQAIQEEEGLQSIRKQVTMRQLQGNGCKDSRVVSFIEAEIVPNTRLCLRIYYVRGS